MARPQESADISWKVLLAISLEGCDVNRLRYQQMAACSQKTNTYRGGSMTGTGATTLKKRNPGFELLRIIAMFMILTLHFNGRTASLLRLGEPATGINIFATLTESIAITGVNAYVLISGYFLSKGRVKPSRLIQLICRVYFYTILISVAMMAVGTYVVHIDSSAYKLVEYIFPISSEHYWFVTAYVIMFVFAPVMNAAVEHLTRKQLKAVLLGLLTWFCFIKSIVPVLFPTDHFGYEYGWFLCLYLIAAYIRKYDIKLFYSAKNSAIVYLISVAVIFTMSVSLHHFNLIHGGLAHYSEVPFNFNFFFTLTGSLGLFSFFRFYRMKEGRAADIARALGPMTFGVYLLHMHVEIRDRWVEWIANVIGEIPAESVPGFALHYLATIIIMFFAGIFVDFICKMVFEYVGRIMHDTRLFKKIRQWDEELC